MQFFSGYTMHAKVPVIVYLFCSIFSLTFCQDNESNYTFKFNQVTVVGVKLQKKITGCFKPNEDNKEVSLIKFEYQRIPVIRRDAIYGLYQLRTIILENDNITDIEPGAFHDLPKLFNISINYNQITVMRDGIFNKLPLHKLFLENNEIEILEPNFLDDMPNLEAISLKNNKIQTWNSEWFKKTPNIQFIGFTDNLITTIPSQAFKGKKNGRFSIKLDKNRIREIDDYAFEGIDELGTLMLQHNAIEKFSYETFDTLKYLGFIILEYNKLQCVPDSLAKLCPTFIHRLDHNPLSQRCIKKYKIRRSSINYY